MLSKVVPANESDARPVMWRRGDSAAQPSGRIPPVGRPSISIPGAVPVIAAPGAAPAATPSADFEAQVAQQLEAAFESGRQQGETLARQALEAEVHLALRQLAQSTADVAATREQIVRRAEADVVQLSIEIARRILHRELSMDPDALAALVKAALEKLAGQQISRVRVHPEHEMTMRAALAQLGRGADVEVVGDPGQPRGGAVFETENGSLDASVDTQLREIERGLADRLQERA